MANVSLSSGAATLANVAVDEQASAPSAPSAGKRKIWVKTDGSLNVRGASASTLLLSYSQGLESAKPAAATAGNGAAYYATDTDGGTLYVSNGTAWTTVANNVQAMVTAKGDLLVADASGSLARLAVGSDGYVLMADSSTSTGVKWTAGVLTNPMTTAEDIIVGGASGTPTRKAKGSNGDVLQITAGAVAWGTPPAGATSDHNHSSSAGDGGKLTNDEHDGYSEYAEIAAPSSPAADKLRLYAKDDGGTTKLYYKRSTGTEVELGAAGSGSVTVQEVDGSPTGSFGTIKVTNGKLTDNGDGSCTVDLTGTSGYTAVEDEGSSVTARTTLNFVGRGVIADDSSSKTRVRVDDLATTSRFRDDFNAGNNATGSLGDLKWYYTSGATPSITTEAGHPGILVKTTSTSSGNITYVYPSAFTSQGTFFATDTFSLDLLVKFPDLDANTTARVGLAGGTGDPDANGAFVEKLNTDTNWFGVARSGGSQTRSDLGTAAGTGWVAFRVRRVDASTVGFRLASTLGGLEAASETTVNTNVPGGSTTLQIMLAVKTHTAALRTLWVDVADLLITGLSR